MKLITAYELERHAIDDLSKVFRDVTRKLIQSEPDTLERTAALCSLETISQAMMARLR